MMKLKEHYEANQNKIGSTTIIGACFWKSENDRRGSPTSAIVEQTSIKDISEVLKDTTGHFSIVTDTENGVAIATDPVSTIPLYYTKTDGTCYVSDSQQYVLKRTSDQSLDPVSLAEYRACTYVTGPQTLINSIYQTEGGTVVEITAEGTTSHRYLDGRFNGEKSRTCKDLLDAIYSAIETFVEYADERPIWIALSGGYDSRLIATILKDLEYEDVNAFSYGLAGNADAKNSRRIAADLNIDWHFLEYTPEKWQRWYESDERKTLDEKNWISSTLPLGDWPAVWQLRKDGTISDSAVVTTGHSGDFLAGSHISKELVDRPRVSKRQFQDWILSQHYNRNDFNQSQVDSIRDRIAAVAEYPGGTGEDAMAYAERWDLFERQTKHITPVVQTFQAHDVDWWLPFFDAELIDFWTKTKLSQRIDESLYTRCVDELYESVTGSTSPARSTRTSSRLGQSIEEVKDVFRDTWVDEKLGFFYKKYVRSTRSSYDGINADPRGILTVMDYDRFKELYNGDIGLASYRARELLGEVKLRKYEWEPSIEPFRDD